MNHLFLWLAGVIGFMPACSAPKREQPSVLPVSTEQPPRSFTDPQFADSGGSLPAPEHISDGTTAKSPQIETVPTVVVADSQPAAELPRPQPMVTPQEVIVQLEGNNFLAVVEATAYSQGVPLSCRMISALPTSRPWGDQLLVFNLVPNDGQNPLGQIEIKEGRGETSITLNGSGGCPQIELIAETLVPMLPVCLVPRESDRVMNAALGPASGRWFDGLFLPERDWAVLVEGHIYFEEFADRVRLTISGGGGRDASEPGESEWEPGEAWRGLKSPASDTLLVLRSERDFLRQSHGLTGYAPIHRRRPEVMPAAWMPLDTYRPPESDEIARNAVWMAINLQPYGAASVLFPGMQSMLPAVRSPEVPPVLANQDSPSRRPRSKWECFQRTAAAVTGRFWGHGLLAQSMSSTMFVGEPLDPEQARLFASLIGLAGQSPIACERMYQLPDERVELLRRIIPAAPVRAVDLFAHASPPPVWNLAVSTEAGRWNVLGLFNTSDEARVETIELEDLHLGTGLEQFAIFDFWNKRLLRVVTDRFRLRVPPAGCRVVSIHQLAAHRPTLVGTSRHITCGGTDLRDVRWDARNLTLSGTSEVVAHDPYELRLLVPEGPESIELWRTECKGARPRVRGLGRLRVVSFETDTSGPLSWQLSFYRVNQPEEPPPPRPRRLAAAQNTRGVNLTWYQADDRAVAHRLYRNHRFLAEVEGCEYQDSAALYNSTYTYAVTAVDFLGQESFPSGFLEHRTPTPASTNLTQLVPLSFYQDRLALGRDRSVTGSPLRIANQRIYRGLGTVAPSRIVYFLGGGYDLFSGTVGIDDSAAGKGSSVFRIVADGQTLFTSPVMRGGESPLPFMVQIRGKLQLELLTGDAGDGSEFDYADWGNAYLRAARPQPGGNGPEPLENGTALEPGSVMQVPAAPQSDP